MADVTIELLELCNIMLTICSDFPIDERRLAEVDGGADQHLGDGAGQQQRLVPVQEVGLFPVLGACCPRHQDRVSPETSPAT